MSLPSFQSPAHGHHHQHGFGHGKITKARSRTAVKPILKKLHSPHSEKNSLDLDRSWEEQTPAVTYTSLDYGTRDDDRSTSIYSSPYSIGDAGSTTASTRTGPRSTRDVSFTLSPSELGGAGGGGSGGARIKYSHARSTSGASHVSIATTNSGRNGSFIHPFQQTPQTSTPPLLSYANSTTSLDNASVGPRDYSPTIAEDELDNSAVRSLDGVDQHAYHSTMAAVASATVRSYHSPVLPHPHPDLRRPSLASSHRTNSLSDVTQPLAVTTSRSNSGLALRTAHGSMNQSRTDPLQGSASSITMTDSPLSTTAPIGSSPLMSASTTPMSPLRSSLDMNGFRLRSRSEVDTVTRQEQVRQARRKFEEKERAKEEKYAREQVRKRERADTKEAQRFERSQTQNRKTSFGTAGLSSGRNSTSTDPRPAASRKSTSGPERSDGLGESVDFATRGYDSVPTGDAPDAKADNVRFEPSKRRTTTKRKTTGTWTAFVLWFRTRLLKMGRR